MASMGHMDQNLVYRYGSTNWNSLINNKNFATQVAVRVKEILKRPLSNQEINYVVTKLKNLDSAYYNKMNISGATRIEDMIFMLANNVITDLQNYSNNQFQDIDTHELLKARIGTTSEDNSAFQYSENQLNGFVDHIAPKKEGFVEPTTSVVTQFMGQSDIAKIRKELNPEANLKCAYLAFDSKNRQPSFGPITNFQWAFIPNASTQVGSINSISMIRDITYLKVFPIRLPYSQNVDNPLGKTTLNIAPVNINFLNFFIIFKFY